VGEEETKDEEEKPEYFDNSYWKIPM